MPGTLFVMYLDEALAVCAMVAVDPGFPADVSDADRQALQTEARHVVECAAIEAAARCLGCSMSEIKQAERVGPKHLKVVEPG